MGGCCGGPSTRVTVEFEYLVVDGATCDRCGDSREGVRAAVADALTMLPQLDIRLIERELAAERLADSNRVLVNGLPAEEWLGGSSAISSCESCSDLLSTPVCCREVEIGGVRTEAISRELVLDAILAAAGLAPAGVPGENCCSAAAGAASERLTVTLVTGPGCGWGGDDMCDPGLEVFIPVRDGATWDMPDAWRVQVMGESLQRSGLRAELEEYDVYALPPELRHRVLDVIVAQSAEFPMVLVNGEVVCHGGIDMTVVLRAAREAMGDDACC